MRVSPSAWRALLAAASGAALLTVLDLLGLAVEDLPRAELTDRALDALLATSLPLLTCLGVWGAGKASHPMATFGESRRASAFWHVAPLLAGLPVVGGLLALGVVVWTRGAHDPRLVADVLVTTPVALMATAAVLALALATFAWLGRWGLLGLAVVLLTVGRSEALGAIVLPLSHVRHLLGVGMVLPFDPAVSMAALAGFSLVGLFAWQARISP